MQRCPHCFFPLVSNDYVCPRCHGDPSVLPVYAQSDYNSNLSYSLLHRFKFIGDRKVAEIVALYMQRALDSLDPEGEALVVPVPCSESSLALRGWDQMLEVCRYIGRRTAALLENTDSNDDQQKLLDRKHRIEKSHRKRFSKAKGVFIPDEALQKPAIVIDDISTTFSTIRSAADCLKEMGFRNVKAAVWLYDYKV